MYVNEAFISQTAIILWILNVSLFILILIHIHYIIL